MGDGGKIGAIDRFTAHHDDKSFAPVGVDIRQRMAKPMDWILGHGMALM